MAEVSEHNLIPFVELEKALETQGYGPVELSVEVYQGKIVAIQGQQYVEHRFKPNENHKAAALILAELKDLNTNRKSGTFVTTITLDRGEIKKVFLQRILNKSYPLTK